MSDFVVSAPGKVILFGEHAVVHGKPAIAASVSLRTYLRVKKSVHPGQISVDFPDVGLHRAWDVYSLPWAQCARHIDNSATLEPASCLDQSVVAIIEQSCLDGISDSFQRAAALAFLYMYMCLCIPETPSMAFYAKSTLPVGAGLGSSASFSVCLAAALLRLGKVVPDPVAGGAGGAGGASSRRSSSVDTDPLDVITKWSFLGECCIHGSPSGIDNAVATRGGAVMFQRPATMAPIAQFPPLRLILTNTRTPRRTSELVAGVATLKDAWPSVVLPILDSIDNISQEAYTLLCSFGGDSLDAHDTVPHTDTAPHTDTDTTTAPAPHTDTDTPTRGHDLALKLAPLVHINHALLSALGVSHPVLEKVKLACDSLNIGETKLTGAGGGGCAITLVTLPDGDHCEHQIRTLGSLLALDGCDVFETVIGGPGVGMAHLVPDLDLCLSGVLHNDDILRFPWAYWS